MEYTRNHVGVPHVWIKNRNWGPGSHIGWLIYVYIRSKQRKFTDFLCYLDLDPYEMPKAMGLGYHPPKLIYSYIDGPFIDDLPLGNDDVPQLASINRVDDERLGPFKGGRTVGEEQHEFQGWIDGASASVATTKSIHLVFSSVFPVRFSPTLLVGLNFLLYSQYVFPRFQYIQYMSIMFNYIPMIFLIISHYTPTIFLIKVTIIISPLCFHEACIFSLLVPLFQCIPMMFLLLHYITVYVSIIIPVYSCCDSSIFPSYSQYIPLYIYIYYIILPLYSSVEKYTPIYSQYNPTIYQYIYIYPQINSHCTPIVLAYSEFVPFFQCIPSIFPAVNSIFRHP